MQVFYPGVSSNDAPEFKVDSSLLEKKFISITPGIYHKEPCDMWLVPQSTSHINHYKEIVLEEDTDCVFSKPVRCIFNDSQDIGTSPEHIVCILISPKNSKFDILLYPKSNLPNIEEEPVIIEDFSANKIIPKSDGILLLTSNLVTSYTTYIDSDDKYNWTAYNH
jgi:hypothetical protein